MITLTISNARKNLGHWLKKARQGEDIGIIEGDAIIALRPVPIESADYANREYGVTGSEIEHFVKHATAEIESDRKSGKLKTYKGDLNALLGN